MSHKIPLPKGQLPDWLRETNASHWFQVKFAIAQLYVGKRTKKGRDRSGARTRDYSVNVRKLYHLSYTVVLYAHWPRMCLSVAQLYVGKQTKRGRDRSGA